MTPATKAWLDRRARFVARPLWAFAYPRQGRPLGPLRKVALWLYSWLLRADLALWCTLWALSGAAYAAHASAAGRACETRGGGKRQDPYTAPGSRGEPTKRGLGREPQES
jgi:hypothetical protein